MLPIDNGSDRLLSGAPNDRWDNDDLHDLQTRITGSHFQALDTFPLLKTRLRPGHLTPAFLPAMTRAR